MAIANPFKLRLRKLSLQQALVAPFLLQIILATGFAGALALYNGQRAVRSLALDLSSEATTNIENHLIDFADQPHTFLQITQAAIATGQLDISNFEALQRYFYRVVRLEDSVRTMYYGDETGQFVLVTQNEDDALSYRITSETAPTREIYQLDDNGERQTLLRTDIYDPRMRPWYESARASNGPTWSPIYYFAAQPVRGVTPTIPIRDSSGRLEGVLAVDITLSQLNDFLTELQIGERGEAIILERSGSVVASSQADTFPQIAEGETPTPFSISDSSDSCMQAVEDHLLNEFGSYAAIDTFQGLIRDSGGESYYVQVDSMKGDLGLDWLMIVAIPSSDLTGALGRSIRDTLALFLVALVLAIVFGNATARWMARPIHELSSVARKMAVGGPNALDLAVPHSAIAELEILSTSVEGLATQLRGTIDRLATTNVELEHRVQQRTATLEAAERHMRVVFSAMTEVILMFDRDGRYTHITSSDPSSPISPPEELLRIHLQHLIGDDDGDRCLAAIQAAIDRDETTDLEYELEIDGQQRCFSGRISPAGATTALLVARDTTEHKHAEIALRQSEEKFAAAFKSSSSPVAIVAVRSSKFLEVNDSFLSICGFEREAAIGRTAKELGLWHRDLTRREIFRRLKTDGVVRNLEVEFKQRSGDTRTLLLSANLIELSGELCVLYVGNDITERQQTQDALQQAEAKYRSIFEQALEGIFQVAPEGQPIGVNPALAAMYGYDSPEQMMASVENVHQQLYVDTLQSQQLLQQLATDFAVEAYESEVRHRDGNTFWVSENWRAVLDSSGQLLYYVGTVEDITTRKVMEQELRFHAFHDPLTGLPNRSLFNDRLGRAIERSKRRLSEQYAVLFLDLDRFKSVNDTLGHAAGDRLLRTIAQRLQQCVRSGDTVSRLGGDEFTILLDDLDATVSIQQTAERILTAAMEPVAIGDRQLSTSTSIGIAIGNPRYNSPAEILRDADAAMYAAKTGGRNRYEIFDRTKHRFARPQDRVAHSAITHQQFH
ncbi:MAG: diguanylate cyclase [Cyanobacteria bacterium P01_A01_bin.3]